MSKKVLVKWLTAVNTKLSGGDTFKAGTLKGQNIQATFSAMSKVDLLQEYEGY